jgi:hypothetical protein
MSWVRIEDTVTMHPKIVRAGNEAVGCWFRLIAWSSSQLTDGHVPRAIAVLISDGNLAVIERLVNAEMLDKDGEDFVLHDYLDYQPSASEVRKQREEQRKQRSAAGTKSAASRSTKRQREVNGAVEVPLPSVSTPSHPIPLLVVSAPAEAIQAVTGRLLSTAEQERLRALLPVSQDELDYASGETRKAPRPSAAYFLAVVEERRRSRPKPEPMPPWQKKYIPFDEREKEVV